MTTAPKLSPYESSEALEQYLFFHYGAAKEYLPHANGPVTALYYPARAVEVLLDTDKLPHEPRALDLGCAVGRTSFELSRYCREVVGIDLSRSFIRAANRMKRHGQLSFRYTVEGDIRKSTILKRPRFSRAERIRFLVGDAQHISPRLGMFDVAVLLNLIDRVPDPAACLRDLTKRLNPGAQLIIASPYTWMEAYTPREKWLGGRPGKTTFSALKEILTPRFTLIRQRQIPFLIREHARKYQWSMAEGTTWWMQSD